MLSPLAIGFGFGKAKQAEAEKEEQGKRAPAAQTAETSTSSWWKTPKAAAGLGALALGAAAAGTAYYRRDDLATGWKWGFDHMTFVKNLWDTEGMKRRMEGIETMRQSHNVTFAK
jgi:hypothetical protein